MFERFKQRYRVTSQPPAESQGSIVTSSLEDTPGYEAFMREYAGATFNNGIYRVHTLEGRAKWNRLTKEAFPRFRVQFSVFAYDWLGRHFALQPMRDQDNHPWIAFFDASFGEILEVPGTFLDFHDQVLITDNDAALAFNAFEDWLQAGSRAPDRHECVGHKIPMVLGGVDDFENYEVTDMEVYWGLNAQLMAQTRDLPDGTPVGKITIDE